MSENVAIRSLLKDVGVVQSSKRHGNVFEIEFLRRR
jgi:hypothetical protein